MSQSYSERRGGGYFMQGRAIHSCLPARVMGITNPRGLSAGMGQTSSAGGWNLK